MIAKGRSREERILAFAQRIALAAKPLPGVDLEGDVNDALPGDFKIPDVAVDVLEVENEEIDLPIERAFHQMRAAGDGPARRAEQEVHRNDSATPERSR